MLCSDFETWNTAHLLARMAGEGYGALLPAPSPSSGKAEVLLRQAEPGGWLVLRKYLLQWLLAVSARCGDARASSEYFAGLTELMAVLEEERRKADRECGVPFPLRGSTGVDCGKAAKRGRFFHETVAVRVQRSTLMYSIINRMVYVLVLVMEEKV